MVDHGGQYKQRVPGIRAFAILLAMAIALPVAAQAPVAARVQRVLAASPVIDAHNDLLWELRERYGSDLAKIDLARSTAALPLPAGTPSDTPALMTDLPRLRAGQVGGQF